MREILGSGDDGGQDVREKSGQTMAVVGISSLAMEVVKTRMKTQSSAMAVDSLCENSKSSDGGGQAVHENSGSAMAVVNMQSGVGGDREVREKIGSGDGGGQGLRDNSGRAMAVKLCVRK